MTNPPTSLDGIEKIDDILDELSIVACDFKPEVNIPRKCYYCGEYVGDYHHTIRQVLTAALTEADEHGYLKGRQTEASHTATYMTVNDFSYAVVLEHTKKRLNRIEAELQTPTTHGGERNMEGIEQIVLVYPNNTHVTIKGDGEIVKQLIRQLDGQIITANRERIDD